MSTPIELLRQYVDAIDNLRELGVLRTENNPTGDYAEWLFCNRFGWEQAPNSEKGFDATAADGTKYQIKGRRLTNTKRSGQSRQLSAIRSMDFDFLAVVLFDHQFEVIKAALVPVEIVKQRVTYIKQVNGYRFMATDAVWDEPNVETVKLE